MRVKRAIVFALAVGLLTIGATKASAQFDVVGIGTDTAIGNGTLITARVSGNTLQTLGVADGNGGAIVDLGWQSDQQLALVTDGSNTGDSGQFGLKELDASVAVGNNGLGEPGSTLSVYDAGPCPDCVFFGTVDTNPGVSNTQVRNPSFGGIATVGSDGVNGGPGQFGDGAIIDSVQQPDGDLIFLYDLGEQSRLRRQLGGDLAVGAGDEGTGGPSPRGIALATQTGVDRIVMARDDRHVDIRLGDASLSPDLGGFGLSAGAFGADITDIAVLSDDAIVIATVAGEIQVRTADLQGVLAGGGGMGGATGQITALAVSPGTDNIFVGTDEGNIRVFTRGLQEIVPLTNYGSGAITALAVTIIPEPSTAVLAGLGAAALLWYVFKRR